MPFLIFSSEDMDGSAVCYAIDAKAVPWIAQPYILVDPDKILQSMALSRPG